VHHQKPILHLDGDDLNGGKKEDGVDGKGVEGGRKENGRKNLSLKGRGE